MEDLSPPDYNGPPSHGRASRQSRSPVLSRLSHSRVGNIVLNLMSLLEILGWRTYFIAGEGSQCS